MAYSFTLPRDGVVRSEEQIERMVERAVDRLDRAYLDFRVQSPMTTAEYEAEMRAIDEWSRIEHHFAKAPG